MKPHIVAVAGCMAIASLVGGCAAPAPKPPPPLRLDLPLSVGNGAGSEHGNYATEEAGEMKGPDGEHCVLFNWDRPLTPALAIRYRSMSCPDKAHPGVMVPTDLGHTIIPIGDSNLKGEAN